MVWKIAKPVVDATVIWEEPGVTRVAIRVGYYPRLMNDDPVTDCTNGCQIPVNNYNAPAWYQILYLDSNNVPRTVGATHKVLSSS